MGSRSVSIVCLAALVLAFAIGADAKWCKAGQGLDRVGNCSPCGRAYYSKGGNNVICKKCPDGRTANGARTACAPCPRNQYGDDGLCKICPKGTYGPTTGAVNITGCIACTNVTGHGVPPKNGTCTNTYLVCSPDYAPITRYCGPAGCWSDTLQCCASKDNSTKCLSPKLEARCALGRGLDEDRRCKKCAPGFYNNGKPPAPFRCKPCKPGTVPSGKGDKCVPCKAGKFSPWGVKCRDCPVGTYSQPGSNKCIKCNRVTVVPKRYGTCRDYIICIPLKRAQVGLCPKNSCYSFKKRACVKVPVKKP